MRTPKYLAHSLHSKYVYILVWRPQMQIVGAKGRRFWYGRKITKIDLFWCSVNLLIRCKPLQYIVQFKIMTFSRDLRFLWEWRILVSLSKRQSPTTVLFRTTLTRTITQYELVIYYLYKMKQLHWLLCVAKNCAWSRKITPLSNLTRESLPVE